MKKCHLPEGETCDYRLQVQQLEDDMEQFTYLTSHDLREPLMAISGFATLLKRRCGEFDGSVVDGNCAHFLDQIIEGSERMERKLDDLLAFSRAGRSVLSERFPMYLAIREARRSLVRKIAESGTVLHVPEDLPCVIGSRSLLAQVFQNLISNSIKYRIRGGEPRVWISSIEYGNGYCMVTVRDNGVGFDMSHRERIFGAFQRLCTEEQYSGTGMGLAIVKKIVKRHGGKIWAESELGKGSKFHFTIPVSPEPCESQYEGQHTSHRERSQ